MELRFNTKIQLLEQIQELHQHLDQPRIHWLPPGAKYFERHLNNLPRLKLAEDSHEADVVIGSYEQHLTKSSSAPYLLITDEQIYASELVTAILLKGYRLRNTRLFQRIQHPTPSGQHLRILIITNLYPPQELGGYGRSIHDFAQNLKLQGHQVRVITSNAPYLGGDTRLDEDVNRSLVLMGTYEEKISLVHDPTERQKIAAHNKSALQREIECMKPNTALLGNLDMLGPECIHQLLYNLVPCWHHFGFSDPAMLPFPATAIPEPGSGYHPVANSHFTARSLAPALEGYQPLPVIYPGAQTHLYVDLQPPTLGGPLRIAYASLLIGAKGPHVLLEALARLEAMGIPFQCEMAGDHIDSSFREQLLAFAQHAGISSQIRWLGKLERHQLRELFARNQIFVFPSTWEEPFGISQVEALAAGLLVVSSGTGGAGETVHDDINGRRFKPGDSEDLAGVLREIYLYPQEHEHLRVRGRRLAQSHFDTAQESRKLSQLMLAGVGRAAQYP